MGRIYQCCLAFASSRSGTRGKSRKRLLLLFCFFFAILPNCYDISRREGGELSTMTLQQMGGVERRIFYLPSEGRTHRKRGFGGFRKPRTTHVCTTWSSYLMLPASTAT